MMSLAQLAKAMNADYQGEDLPFRGVSIDTRTLQPGHVFVAIKGPNFDGHHFISQAIEKGASAVMVSQNVEVSVPRILVEDTVTALGKMAQVWRAQFAGKVVALTGSCGKTGTKEMVASILGHAGPTLATLGNNNNQLGVPLSLLRLRPEHKFAVIEMGTSQPGEIPYLAKLVKPDIALITNISPNHAENFDSFEDLIKEKMSIFTGLDTTGIAIFNADESEMTQYSDELDHRHKVTFGVLRSADVMAKNVKLGLDGVHFQAHTPIGDAQVYVPLMGEHVVYNALAAIASAMAAGADLEHVKKGLAELKPVKGRLHPYRLNNGALLIDDTYNASASSVESAIKTLARFNGRRIFVMSNMAELGEYANVFHRKMGEWACEHELDHMLLTGDPELLKATLHACDDRAQYFGSKEELLQTLHPLLDSKTMVIVKGSRSNRMESVVTALLAVSEDMMPQKKKQEVKQ